MNGDGPARERVALVEDDPDLLEELAAGLEEQGFSVIACPSAEAFWRASARMDFDLVVLDVGLSGEDGYSVLRRLGDRMDIGKVMLTARALPAEQALGLSAGADAYLPKPADLLVLAATLRSVARRLQRSSRTPGWRLADGGWSLHAPDGQAIELTGNEKVLLESLFERPGEPVARDVLIDRLSDGASDFDPHRLDVLVHRLRKKLSARRLRLPVRAIYRGGFVFSTEDEATSASA
ncbi:MAG TPA: response regulator transcription factor [Lysobacter sp.]|nr:response regulator transcription factor [Lysobacter sp.]